MAQFPFRRPVNPEDSPDDQAWTPPDYAKPANEQNSGEVWKPPDYAVAAKAEKVKTPHEKAKEGVTFAGSLKKNAKFTKNLVHDKIGEFVTSALSDKPEHSFAERLLTSKDPGKESALPPLREPSTWWGGFRKGLYDEFVRPLASAEGVAMLLGGGEAKETTADQIAALSKEPKVPERPVLVRPIGPTRPQSRALPPPSFIPLGPSSLEGGEIPPEARVQEPPVKEQPKPKFTFVNPFEKKAAPIETPSEPPIVDEKGTPVAPAQEAPTELPIKAPGTEYQPPAAETKETSSDIPIKRDILRDYTGKDFSQEEYDKARQALGMGFSEKNPSPSGWKPPSYAQPAAEDIKPGKLSKMAPETDLYDIAKANLDQRNATGEVVDYEEELHNLMEQHGVIDTMSEETKKINREHMDLLDKGYALYPKDYRGELPYEPIGTTSDGYRIVPQKPELVDKMPSELEDNIEKPKLVTEQPRTDVSSSVADMMEAMDRVEKTHPDPGSLSDDEYDALVEKHLNDIQRERAVSGDDIVEMHGGPGGGKRRYPKSTGPAGPILDKLFQATLDAKEKVVEQEGINRAERAKRFAAFSGVKAEGAKGAAQSLSQLKGEFDKVNPGEGLKLSQDETDSLFTAIKKARITPGEQARGYTALFKILNGDGLPARSDLAVLDHVFGNNFVSRIEELHGGLGAVSVKLSKVANTMKTMQNMLSLAAPLRHGIGMLARKEFYPAFRDMFKMFGNKEFFDASMKAIEEDPKYLAAREDGLFLPKMSSGADEEFLDSYIGNFPKWSGVPQAAAASKRAYSGFLNKLKFDVYKSMTTDAEKLGYSMTKVIKRVDEEGNMVNHVIAGGKESRGIANFVNTFTGRGDLGRFNKITRELNLLLWSPRMIASRLQMFTSPKLYIDLPKEMRIEGLKSLFAIAGLGTVIDTAASLAGAKVSTNILSTDFGKARFGTDLIDPWGGFQQYVVAAARFLSGKTDSPTPQDRLGIAGRFLANKESPAASLAHTLMTARKFTGKSNDPKTAGNFINEYGQNTSVQREIIERFMPIFEQDLQNLIESDPEWANNIGLSTALTGASAAGMAQSYPEKKTGRFGTKKMKLR